VIGESTLSSGSEVVDGAVASGAVASGAVARLSRRAPGRWLDVSGEPSLTVGLLPRDANYTNRLPGTGSEY